MNGAFGGADDERDAALFTGLNDSVPLHGTTEN